MTNPDMPYAANPAAIGNVGLILTAHFMAFLLKNGRLSEAEVAEIFRDTRKRYTSIPVGQVPQDDWEKQTTAILASIHGDVLHFAGKA